MSVATASSSPATTGATWPISPRFHTRDDQRGGNQERRADVGEDVLLDIELERVEQHWDGRHRGEPAPAAEVDENRVDQHGRGQPEQVLRERNHDEVVDQHRPG